MISYRFVPISSQNGVLFFETPGRNCLLFANIFTEGVQLIPAYKNLP